MVVFLMDKLLCLSGLSHNDETRVRVGPVVIRGTVRRKTTLQIHSARTTVRGRPLSSSRPWPNVGASGEHPICRPQRVVDLYRKEMVVAHKYCLLVATCEVGTASKAQQASYPVPPNMAGETQGTTSVTGIVRQSSSREGETVDDDPTPIEDERGSLLQDVDAAAILTHPTDQERREPITSTSSVGEYNRNTIAKWQLYAFHIAHGLALSTILVVVWWIRRLGGLSWQKGAARQVFNWHPLLMIVSYAFMTVAALSFRYHVVPRSTRKLAHGVSWLVAALCGGVGVVAVVQSHNDKESGYIANLYSFHSWIGVVVMLLYILQFGVGVAAFAPTGSLGMRISSSSKALVLLFHKSAGPMIYALTACTIMLGIQEKEGFIGCSYAVTSPDVFPIQHFGDIPFICRISHLLGIVVAATAVSTAIALVNVGQ